jgi:hypothetical protein
MFPENEEIESILRALDNREVLIFPDMLPIGKQIRLKRCFHEMTLPELAEMLHMGASTISEIENAHRSVPRKHKEKIEWFLYEYDEFNFFQRNDAEWRKDD